MPKRPNQFDERAPVEVGTIQVNFCKNPQCQNFGIPASTIRRPRGRGAAERSRDTYSVVGSGRGPCFGAVFEVNKRHTAATVTFFACTEPLNTSQGALQLQTE